MKYRAGFFFKPYRYTAYGSYHKFVHNLATNVARYIPNTPYTLPKTTSKNKLIIPVKNSKYCPYRNRPNVLLYV